MKKTLLLIIALVASAFPAKITLATLYNDNFSHALTKVHAVQTFRVKVALADFRRELDQISQVSEQDSVLLAQRAKIKIITSDTSMTMVARNQAVEDVNESIKKWGEQELPLKTKLPIRVPVFSEALTLEEQTLLIGVIQFDIKEPETNP